MVIEHGVMLAPLTTLEIGGPAQFFTRVRTLAQIKDALTFANTKKVGTFILGGGSNVVFADKGFDGLVIRMESAGIHTIKEDNDHIWMRVDAGVPWDEFVAYCVSRGYSGIECLSGIPGSTGATPIQNVGAYGQDVSQVISRVRVLDTTSHEITELSNRDCRFSYRMSIFKSLRKHMYIVLAVEFQLSKSAPALVTYQELLQELAAHAEWSKLDRQSQLNLVREGVLTIRRRKSMVWDQNDPNSKSAGSFFLNPIVDERQLTSIKSLVPNTRVPAFPYGNQYKISAAWLLEQSGFHRGYRMGGVGLSANHALAIINVSGTAQDIRSLAAKIQAGVHERFGIKLETEPLLMPEPEG